MDGKPVTIGVTRIHIEEDAGKLIHLDKAGGTLVDMNRCGVQLIEIVSEPDFRSTAQVKAYLDTIKLILQYLDTVSYTHLLISEKGEDFLTPELKQAAQLRLDNPEASLSELLAAADFPVSRSGLNHRLNRLCLLADRLKEKH